MTGLSAVSLMLGAFLTGAVLMGAVGVPLAGRRGYARGLEARQLIDWSAELRETADAVGGVAGAAAGALPGGLAVLLGHHTGAAAGPGGGAAGPARAALVDRPGPRAKWCSGT